MKVPQNHRTSNNFYYQDFPQKENYNNQAENQMNLHDYQNGKNNFFEKSLENNEKKLGEDTMKYTRHNNKFFQFNSSTNSIEFASNNILEKKRNSFSYTNMSLIERRMESSMNYVGFENNYGDNSCFINVILHFLYQFSSVNEFFTDIYNKNIKKYNSDNNIIIKSDFKNIDYFLFLLGKTLFEYQNILSKFDDKSITILNTIGFRQCLQEVSNNLYAFNKFGDPVELLEYLLDLINERNSIRIHQDFFINLTEEIKCESCHKSIQLNKYNENTFFHYVNVNEIINNINKNKLEFWGYTHKLFKFSNQIDSECLKKCENCGKQMKKTLKLIGPNFPKYLLLNCSWGQNLDIKDVCKFLYITQLEANINELFFCENQPDEIKKSIYNLFGMILYSKALSHYISVIFNWVKNIFILYNDDKIKELSSIHEVYKEITAEQMKINKKAFFYPVLLVYIKDIIYEDNLTLKLNQYSYANFIKLNEECTKAENENIVLNEEQKRQNFLELVKAQEIYERKKKRKFSMEPFNNSFEMIIEEENKDVNSNKNYTSCELNYINNIGGGEDKKENNNDMKIEDNNINISQAKTEKKRKNKRSETHYIPPSMYSYSNSYQINPCPNPNPNPYPNSYPEQDFFRIII